MNGCVEAELEKCNSLWAGTARLFLRASQVQ